MTNVNNKDNGVNPVAAGVAGAVVGAGLAVGATQAFKNEKVQKKAKEILDNVREQAKEYLDKTDLDEKAKDTATKVKKVVSKNATKKPSSKS